MIYLFQGFLLGLAYVAPIGTQNLYVINSSLRGTMSSALKAALITVFFDVTLALSCFFGLGYFIERFFIVRTLMLLFGSITLLYIGLMLIISISKRPEEEGQLRKQTLNQTIAKSFIVTWLNPQAVIDGTLLLGGYRAALPDGTAVDFIIGVSLASFSWFVSLSLIISLCKSKFSIMQLRSINMICGVIIVFYGIKLAADFIYTVF